MFARIDAGQFEQALINLAVNARDAMPDGGQLRIQVREARGVASASAANAGSAADDRTFVEVVVRDSGTGIPADVLERVCEPLFTTKPAGAGSGLGLAMVSGFAAQAGGDVSVESTVGKGTAVAIRLPVVPAPWTRRETAAKAGSPRRLPRRPAGKVAAMQPSGAHIEAHAG